MSKLPKDSAEVKKLLTSMSKFGATSLLGTAADFFSWTFIFRFIVPLFWAEICAAFVGMVINFFMQKRFVFTLQRKVQHAFILSILFSVVLMVIGAQALVMLLEVEWLASYPLLVKLFVMGSKFVVNYFSKRWVFEK